MTSIAKAKANQKNARKSTGPKAMTWRSLASTKSSWIMTFTARWMLSENTGKERPRSSRPRSLTNSLLIVGLDEEIRRKKFIILIWIE